VHSPEELIAKVQTQRVAPPDQEPGKDNEPGGKPRSPRPGPPPGPDRDPERPPRVMPHRSTKVPMPEQVAQVFRARRGYANYYFNQLNQDRVWNAQLVHGDFSTSAGWWTLEGKLGDANDVRIELRDNEAIAELPDGPVRVDLLQDATAQLAPEDSGGLLLALSMWRRLLVLGPEKYGDVYYLGTVPLPEQDHLVDVLVATHDVVETHFLFDPASGQLVALEMFPDTGVDPCEVYFEDYRDVAGRWLPHRLIVRHGDTEFAQLQLQRYDLKPQKEAGA
jgi:hypothetical protein